MARPIMLQITTRKMYVYEMSNISLNKPAALSTQFGTRTPADNAVDGSLVGIHETCAITKYLSSPSPWFRVDLQQTLPVRSVALQNRDIPYYWNRMNPFDVRVGMSLENDGRVNPKCINGARFTQINQYLRLECPSKHSEIGQGFDFSTALPAATSSSDHLSFDFRERPPASSLCDSSDKELKTSGDVKLRSCTSLLSSNESFPESDITKNLPSKENIENDANDAAVESEMLPMDDELIIAREPQVNLDLYEEDVTSIMLAQLSLNVGLSYVRNPYKFDTWSQAYAADTLIGVWDKFLNFVDVFRVVPHGQGKLTDIDGNMIYIGGFKNGKLETEPSSTSPMVFEFFQWKGLVSMYRKAFNTYVG
eukprot:gene4245-20436_t